MKVKITYLLIAIIALICVIFFFTRGEVHKVNDAMPLRPVSQAETVESNEIKPVEPVVTTKTEEIIYKEKNNTKEQNEIETLINGFADPDVKASLAAADTLAGMGAVAVPALLQRIDAAEVGEKGQIIFLLGRIGDTSAVEALIETLKEENAYIRGNAAEALGKIKDPAAVGSLLYSLGDEDIAVRERSAYALAQIGDTRTAFDLLKHFDTESEDRVKSAIIEAFGTLKAANAAARLLEELSRPADQLFKNKIVVALGEIGDKNALGGLNSYLKPLKELKTEDPLIKFQVDEAIHIAEQAIEKIKRN